MSVSWEGNERRKTGRDDHDVLTRIDANLSNFMSRFEDHSVEDKKNFDSLNAKTSRLEKFLYMVMGAIGLFEILVRILK